MASRTDYFFKRTGSFTTKEISLDNVDLQILALIEQKKSARQIGQELNLNPLILKQKITALHKQKLIKVVENYDCMDKEFSDILKKKLIEIVGPIGSMIFEDVLDNLKLEADNIPEMIAKDFIHMLASEIPNEQQSREFKTNMLIMIRKN